MSNEEATKTDAQIAREQNITRQAIRVRRNQKWTQEEIEQGFRDKGRKGRYETEISRTLGMTVKEAAQREGVSVFEIYRRYKRKNEGKDAGVPILRRAADQMKPSREDI